MFDRLQSKNKWDDHAREHEEEELIKKGLLPQRLINHMISLYPFIIGINVRPTTITITRTNHPHSQLHYFCTFFLFKIESFQL